jgi:ATPase subunit of ABC transporter with duplicated ATPase domains
VTVSHDRFFLDKIATQILSFERDGRVLDYPGNYTEFHDWRERKEGEKRRNDEAGSKTGDRIADTTAASADVPELSKNQRIQIEKRISEIEKLLPQWETDAAELMAQMSQPDVAADFDRLSEMTKQHADIEGRVKALYREWEDAAEKLG